MLYKDYVERKVSNAIRIKSAEGYPCVFDNSKGRPLKDYKIYGNSIQDGTPTPESPVEVQSVGDLVTDTASEYYGKYDIPITVTGKNLIKYPYYHTTRTVNGVTWTDNGDGTITASGTPTDNTSFFLANRMSISTNTKYCFSGIDGTSNIMLNVTLYDENNTFVADLSNTNTSNSLAFDTTDYPSAIYARFLIKRKKNGVEVSGTIKPQLELGTTATEYEPYKGSITEHIYLDEPLRKFKDYADYIDFKKGTVVRNITAGVLDGSEGWGTSGTRYYYYNTKLNIKCLGNEVTGIRSNALPSVAWNWIRNSGTGIATYSGTTGGAYNNRIDIRADSLWKNVAEAKEYMANNPIHYIAPCLEPVEEDIELPKILTQKGSNIITAATAIQPSYIEVKYIAK